jgi:bacteriocin biosynthesis cyclodehydratase domain-containing protein
MKTASRVAANAIARVPRLAARYRVVAAAREGAFVLSEAGHAILEGPLFASVVPLIDGATATREIAARLSAAHSVAEVMYAILMLQRAGIVVEAEESPPHVDAVYWSLHQIDRSEPVRRVDAPGVSLRVVGAADPTLLADALAAAGVRTGDGLTVVVTDDLLRAALSDINRTAIEQATPWLLVRLVGQFVSVGPLFVPSRTACWECIAHRLRGNRQTETALRQHLGAADVFPVPLPSSAATRNIAAGMAAAKIAEWIARDGNLPELEDTIVSFDVGSLEARRHRVVRQPFCPACGEGGSPQAIAARPLELCSRPKSFTADGAHRAATPDETLRRYDAQISPISGVVSELSRCDIGSAIHVYAAGDNRAVVGPGLHALRAHFRSKSSGKGLTANQARASALCESIERYSGFFQGWEPRRRATLRELGESAVDPRHCMLYSERQYRERASWNALPSRFNAVPVPFDERDAIDWSPVWSLSRRDTRWLPTAFLYYGYEVAPEKSCFRACSNGNAAGNTVEEAIVQGFLELVERDAVAIWWYNRLRRPALDLDSFDLPFVRELRAFLEQCGRDLWMLDLTCDTDIPVFVALSRRHGGGAQRIVMGFGAHTEPRLAVSRAATELGQMLSWVVPAERAAEREAIRDRETRAWLDSATVARHAHLAPSGPPRGASAFRYEPRDDLRDDIEAFHRLVRTLGLEMLVLEQTRPDVGMPVVKVIVPGLRHFHARFAPGRLYDVPVRLGWLGAPLAETELNPTPIFL